jgi:protein-serine/threonine kinase
LTSNIDTAYYPTDELDQTDIASRLEAQGLQGVETPVEDALEMSLPFIGYTFKRFDANFR